MPRKKKGNHPKALSESNVTNAQPSLADGPPVLAKNSTTEGKKIASDELRINKSFANHYEESKRRQFLSNAPALALDKSDESSSSSEEEDEFGELLTKSIDRKVNQTLDAIRRKDPRIYNKDVKFFEDVGDRSGDKSSETETDDKSDDEPVAGWDAIAKAAEQETPKLTLKDYVRESLLHDGRLSDDDEDENHSRAGKVNSIEQKDDLQPSPREKDNVSSFTGNDGRVKVVSFGSDGDETSDDDDGFFTKKEKTAGQLEEEARDLEIFMKKRSASSSKKAGEDLLLHSYLEKETPDEKERFLRDFVLNNGWLDKNASQAPGSHDYEIEIDANHGAKNDEDLEHETEFDEKADNFEAQHNFRFEDPDAAKIVSHTRNIPDSMRRPDTRRKRAREARKLRKDREKADKTEEIKHLKNMKKKEIEARLMAIQEAAGDGVDLNGLDLEGDFDPDTFDKQMETKFNDEYYCKEDIYTAQNEEEHTTFGRERQRVDRHAENIPEDVNADVQRMTDAYYNLDFEDIVGGVPMRFNYKRVEPESFSMTAEEILNADDKELNRAVSLRYLAPYVSNREVQKQAWKARTRQRQRANARAPHQEGNPSGPDASHDHYTVSNRGDATSQHSTRRQKRKANFRAPKLDLRNSGEAGVTEAPDQVDLAQDSLSGSPHENGNGDTHVHDQEPSRRKKKRKRKRKSEGLGDQEPMRESRMKAYGLGS